MRGIEGLRRRAQVVFVGPGTPAMAKAFEQKVEPGDIVLSDVDRHAFAAAGMRRGFGSLMRLGAIRNLWRAWRAGFRQSGVQGDPWQQGGVMVFDGAGTLLHEQRDRAAGDSIDADALRAALSGFVAG